MLKTIKLRSVNVITSGLTGSLSEDTLTGNTRNISIPFNLDFNPMDQSDLVEDFIETKLDESINEIANYEVARWAPSYDFTAARESECVVDSYYMQFDFYDRTNALWVNNFSIVDFDSDDISSRNNFKRSFFQLDFYDTNDVNTQKFLFNIVIPASNSSGGTSSFMIKNGIEGYYLFWLKNDFVVPYQINSIGNIYMRPSFYNAKNGKIYSFFRPTDSSGNILNSPPTFSEYTTNFKDWTFLKYDLNNRRLQYSNSLLTQQNYDVGGGNTSVGNLTFNQGYIISDSLPDGTVVYRGFHATSPITVNVILNVTAIPSGNRTFSFFFKAPGFNDTKQYFTNTTRTMSKNFIVTLQPGEEVLFETSGVNGGVSWIGNLIINNVNQSSTTGDFINFTGDNLVPGNGPSVTGYVKGSFSNYNSNSVATTTQITGGNIIRFVEIKIQ